MNRVIEWVAFATVTVMLSQATLAVTAFAGPLEDGADALKRATRLRKLRHGFAKTGDGVPKDDTQALVWYKKAADQAGESQNWAKASISRLEKTDIP